MNRMLPRRICGSMPARRCWRHSGISAKAMTRELPLLARNTGTARAVPPLLAESEYVQRRTSGLYLRDTAAGESTMYKPRTEPTSCLQSFRAAHARSIPSSTAATSRQQSRRQTCRPEPLIDAWADRAMRCIGFGRTLGVDHDCFGPPGGTVVSTAKRTPCQNWLVKRLPDGLRSACRAGRGRGHDRPRIDRRHP